MQSLAGKIVNVEWLEYQGGFADVREYAWYID